MSGRILRRVVVPGSSLEDDTGEVVALDLGGLSLDGADTCAETQDGISGLFRNFNFSSLVRSSARRTSLGSFAASVAFFAASVFAFSNSFFAFLYFE